MVKNNSKTVFTVFSQFSGSDLNASKFFGSGSPNIVFGITQWTGCLPADLIIPDALNALDHTVFRLLTEGLCQLFVTVKDLFVVGSGCLYYITYYFTSKTIFPLARLWK